mgnify:CR=1 FL=1
MTKSSVSAPQFFALLYLSMLGSMFMYISSPEITIATAESLLRPIVFAVVSIIFAIPIYFLCTKSDFKENLHSEKRSKIYKGVAIFYGLVYFIDALMTVGRFDLFASSELFPGTEMTYFLIGLVAVCVALSFCGIGALGRASTIFTLVVITATLFASFTLSKEVDFLNFTPLFENGVGKFISDSLSFSIQASEIGAIVIFFPEIKGNIKKHYLLWSVLSALSFSFILFFVIGTLGVFADTQLFPTYSAVTLASFGLFERLDALETAIWILCVVTKLTLYISAIVKCICYAFPKLCEKITAVFVGAVIAGFLIFISGNIMNFDFISFTPLVIGVYLVPVLILPSVLIVFNKLKRRKNDEKTV